MLRRYFKTFACLMAALILFLGGFAVNLLSPSFQDAVDGSPAIRWLLWGIAVVGFCITAFFLIQEHNEPAHPTDNRADTNLAADGDQINRTRMLKLVRRSRIEADFHQSLWNDELIRLNLASRPGAVIRPGDWALRRTGQPDVPISPGTSILEIYEQEEGELLLLGEPGAGKTTHLLEIAESLLQQAENDPTLPIPVIFNLSTWREPHTQLDTWLVERLNREYAVSEKIARRWIERGELILLLDGLDEVKERRAACVEAINAYRQHHQSVIRPMVVCCRREEYDQIPDLRLTGAVVLQPLTKKQVDDYLQRGGAALTGLRAVLKDEPDLYRKLFSTPLMLYVAVITYEGQSAAALRREASPEERRKRLWDAYIERMFERKKEPRYEKSQALDWLEWLASYLTRKKVSTYLIEEMQTDALSRRWHVHLVRWLVALLLGVGMFSVFFMVGNNLFYCLFMLLLFGWIGHQHELELRPVGRLNPHHLRGQWTFVFRQTLQGLVLGTLLAVVLVWLSNGAIGRLSSHSLGAVLAVALPCGIFFTVLETIDLMFEASISENTVRPNEGIHNSFLIAVLYAVLCAVLCAVVGAVGSAVVGAVGGAVIGAAVYGGRTVFQHYLLRLFLWQSGTFPYKITPFLDWAALMVLTKRVGGGWQFIHRTLQERLAERYAERNTRSRK